MAKMVIFEILAIFEVDSKGSKVKSDDGLRIIYLRERYLRE